MQPNNVISPQRRLKLVKIIYECDSFSIASIIWDNVNRIGIRWNGKENEIGYPQSCGRPTWFILPKPVALAFVESIGDIEMKTIVQLSSDEIL